MSLFTPSPNTLLEIGLFSLITLALGTISASIEIAFFYLRLRDLGASPRTGWQPAEERWWYALFVASVVSAGFWPPRFSFVAEGLFFMLAITSVLRRSSVSRDPWRARRAGAEIQELISKLKSDAAIPTSPVWIVSYET